MTVKQSRKRYSTVTVVSKRQNLCRDVRLKAKAGQPGVTKEDLRQLARLGYQGQGGGDGGQTHFLSQQTMVKRIRQWGVGLGTAFLVRRPADQSVALLGCVDDPVEPEAAPALLQKGSPEDPDSIANQLTPDEAKERLARLYDKYGIPEWLGIHPDVDRQEN